MELTHYYNKVTIILNPVEAYFTFHENPEISDLIAGTHTLILSLVPQAQASIKWNIPFYTYIRNLCYLNPKKDHIYIGFPYGVHLSNEQGLLETAGRKQVRTISIYKLKDLETPALAEVILEAALYNEQSKL